jgi:AcrR family transcriptional regulator
VLVQAAAVRFAAQGAEGTSLREVAEDAGVTPAMVAYYFRDKSGLLEAVVRQGLGALLRVVETAVREHEPGEFLPTIIRRYLAALAADPWIPQILIREVISRESPLRELFIEEFASHAVSVVPAEVLDDMGRGALRDDLDPRFLVLSMLGMCVFPFIAHPVLGPLLEFNVDDTFAVDYGEHVLALFAHGAAGSGQ